MSAKKKETPSSRAPAKASVIVGWLFFGPPRGLTWSVVALLAFTSFCFALWRHVRPQVLAGRDYQLGPRDVEITPPPNWIRTDLAGDVVRSLSIDAPLSILDDNLTERLGKAFSAQPWVEKVERVAKQHPARVRVDLVYRRPACMVEAPAGRLGDRVNLERTTRLLPVDVYGVLLPERDFSEAQRQQYPRLVGAMAAPPGVAGSRWGDGRVVGGAQIASALADVWNELGLDRIVASQAADISLGTDEFSYELFTPGGTRILWGHAPSTRNPGEVPTSEKVARLKREKKQHTSLEGLQLIDLRHWHHARVIPRESRTATLPEPEKTRQ